jgi:DNA-directed RNA polymerase subunit RPC12/RpoP
MASLLRNNPELAKEWHPTKNGSLEPADLTLGSNRKVWWICAEGHEWLARVNDRTYRRTGCPYCSGRRVCIDNCLYTLNPTLAREWHPSKNGSLTAKDVTRGSTRKVWWVCGKGHEWEAEVRNRSRGYGCPYCAGRAVGSDNCLEAINPKLAKQWHPKKNGGLTPKDVTPNSDTKAWWICGKGY